MDADKLEIYKELNRRGALPPDKKEVYDELVSRGVVADDSKHQELVAKASKAQQQKTAADEQLAAAQQKEQFAKDHPYREFGANVLQGSRVAASFIPGAASVMAPIIGGMRTAEGYTRDEGAKLQR